MVELPDICHVCGINYHTTAAINSEGTIMTKSCQHSRFYSGCKGCSDWYKFHLITCAGQRFE